MDVLLAMAVFLFSHVAISRSGVKPLLVRTLGERTYLIIYSSVSVVLLSWVIWEVITAERMVLWSTPSWAHAFAAIATLVSFVLIGVGAMSPNPLSVGFRKRGFDPNRPGFVGWVRHPLIWGLTLWGVAHIPANGDWPSLILFAGSAGFGAIGAVALERRSKRQLGSEEWGRLTSGAGTADINVVLGAAIGVAFWVLFLRLHPFLFGVDPLAFMADWP